ncbi:MAG TPA: SDR family NAD(P)-dependent oxidoreductase [Solirubrobacteraceae bacterium]|nr:SDR family NAD(P)-dependent oxidoreductase [Solirubrobacteraceae bacterium]
MRRAFEGRVAIVTGAGRGLGRAYALELARQGAAVVVNDIGDPDAVVAEIVAAGGRAVANADSVSTPLGGQAIVDAAVNAFGTVDAVVNNAGIVRDKSFAKLELADLEAVLDVHLRGAFHVSQPAFRVMKERGYGRLLFVTSGSGLFGNFGQANYAAAKMGLVGLTRTVAIEGARYGIAANAIAPLANTPMTDGLFGGAIEDFDADSVVPMALHLVSEDCTQTGEVFSAGGGRYARVTIGVTRGWVDEGSRPSLETLRQHIDEICSDEGAVEPRSLAEEIELARSVI